LPYIHIIGFPQFKEIENTPNTNWVGAWGGLPRCTHGFSFLTLFTPPNYTSSIEPFWTTIKENKMI